MFFIFPAFGLKCFNCENHVNPACGVYFKAYQFKADHCPGADFKCALQRQQAKGMYTVFIEINFCINISIHVKTFLYLNSHIALTG